MTPTEASPRALRPVPAGELLPAVADALAGGAPVAPLPADAVERQQSLAVLRLDQPVTEADAAAVVVTSGSTGQPKGVVLSGSAIAASVSATHARLGGPGDWVLALPTHYVAGLMVLARAVLGGGQVLEVPADLSSLPEVLAGRTGRSYLSVVPTQLRRACADPRLAAALAELDAVLVGGAATDPQLLDLARAQNIPVIPTYGMSETCGGCVYDGVPLDGVQLGLEPPDGRVLLGGPSLFSGYRLRPDLTAAAMRDGWLLTSDRGALVAGRLEVHGRRDDVVISGGINVDLGAVERAAQAWPGLNGSEIAVVGVPDVDWGTRIVAVTDGAGTEADLRSHLLRLLPRQAAPRQLARVTALPKTAAGKVDRQRLIADLVTATGEVAGSP